MFALFTPIARLLHPQPAGATLDPMQHLLESADARAGHNPQQARELRQAAAAWMRVVR